MHFRGWLHYAYGVPHDHNRDLRGMLTSRLICLSKAHSSDVRPLLLQPCWMKVLHGSLVAPLFALSKPMLDGLQLGIGSSNASTVMHGTLQHALQETPTPLVVKLDISNAFSSINRFALAQVLSRTLPAEEYRTWMPWVENILCQPFWLLPPTGCPVEWWCTQQGVAQGNPLSSWMFSCALTLVLRHACADSAAKFLASVDDTVMYGTAADLDSLWPCIEPALSSLGLLLQPQKSLAFSPDIDDARAAAPRISSHVQAWTSEVLRSAATLWPTAMTCYLLVAISTFTLGFAHIWRSLIDTHYWSPVGSTQQAGHMPHVVSEHAIPSATSPSRNV